MKNPHLDEPSAFACILSRLIDESPVLRSRVEWCNLLGVTQDTISQWLSDTTVPTPNQLNMIVIHQGDDLLRQEFWKVAEQPATEVTPHGSSMDLTIMHYICQAWS